VGLYVTHTFGTEGPHLQCISFGFESQLDLEQLRKKLAKPYSKAERLELLAYIDRGEMAFLGATERIEELIAELLPNSSSHCVDR
jgi:hypothetical protein